MFNNINKSKSSQIHQDLNVLEGEVCESLILNRPSNVDDKSAFIQNNRSLRFGKIGERITIVFPLHPRTKNRAKKHSELTERLEPIYQTSVMDS